jgi:hypothetical protein
VHAGTRGRSRPLSLRRLPTEHTRRRSRVVFVSSQARETRASNGFPRRRRSPRQGGPVPNRVPKRRPEHSARKEENPAGMRDRGWRDPDSNRGHHDFQSWTRISLTTAESLQMCVFAPGGGGGPIAANCGLFSSIWAPIGGSVPNRIAASRYVPWRVSAGQFATRFDGTRIMESLGSNGPSSPADHLVDLPAITLEQPEATTARVSAKSRSGGTTSRAPTTPCQDDCCR